MPVAPPKASPPSTPNKLQDRDQEGVGTERCEQYTIDEPVLCKDGGEYFEELPDENTVGWGGGLVRTNRCIEGTNDAMRKQCKMRGK